MDVLRIPHSSAKGFHVLAKVDKGGDCKTKKSDEEDGETEEVGRFAGGAGHRRHDRARGGGRQAHGKGGIIRGHADTDLPNTCAYLFDRRRTNLTCCAIETLSSFMCTIEEETYRRLEDIDARERDRDKDARNGPQALLICLRLFDIILTAMTTIFCLMEGCHIHSCAQ